MIEPRDEYERRLATSGEAVARGERMHVRVSNLRLAVVALAALEGWLTVHNGIPPVWLLFPTVFFIGLVVVHARVLNHLERARRTRSLYQRGANRLDGRWAGKGCDGARFLEDHPYARDLDLFGHASLFELLDTARTDAGEETLAGWLRRGAPVDEVRARQAAVDELRPMIDFREELSVLASETPVARTGVLAAWATGVPTGFPVLVRVVFASCAVATITLFVAAARAPSAPIFCCHGFSCRRQSG